MSADPNNSSAPGEISEALLRWRQLREQGLNWTLEQLCPDRPDLHEELYRQITAIEAMEGKLFPALRATLPMPEGQLTLRPTTRTIPGYEILGELGRGGMGVVYKARQVRLNRLVALKMILAGSHAGAEQRERFQAEAESLARLRHPNIVQVYESGEADGLPYLSLEYVEGGSLEQRLHGGPLETREAAELIETLARAVQCAHDAGIVHRDLKPANILLSDEGRATGGERGQQDPQRPSSLHSPLATGHSPLFPKITDFGLARVLDSERRTRSGDVLGTPCFMAPEQAEGRVKDIGPGVDVYALGAILYQCLTGQPPFQGQTLIDILRQVTGQEPTPPSKLIPRLPRDLETICLKCLEKAPAQRYLRAAELAEDLRRYREGQPITARRVGVLERGLKWVRRRPERATLVLMLVLVPVLGFLFWPANDPPASGGELPEEARAILLKYCFSCHGQDPGKVQGKLFVLDHARLIDPGKPMVVPGDVQGSHLIERIEDGSMPPEENEEYPRLASAEVEILRKWVMGGAREFRGPEPADHQVPPVDPLATQVQELLGNRCRECHQLGNAKNGIKVLNHDLLVEKRKLVIPGRPDDSPLYRALITAQGPKRMPPPPREALPPREIELVRRWIEAGAPRFRLPPVE